MSDDLRRPRLKSARENGQILLCNISYAMPSFLHQSARLKHIQNECYCSEIIESFRACSLAFDAVSVDSADTYSRYTLTADPFATAPFPSRFSNCHKYKLPGCTALPSDTVVAFWGVEANRGST